ncbi:MAG: hypothetical protein K8M05_07420 [Deltaproteobacteria bacterium]|nr:hypothetical protein [Kofleriaceae bacterium]
MKAPRIDNQFPHAGLAAYFARVTWTDRARAERIAQLLVDERWPWLPCWLSYSGLHKRDDRKAGRVGGKNGAGPILDALLSDKLMTLRLNRARGDGDFTTVMLNLDREKEKWSEGYQLRVTCRSAELPEGKSFEGWIELMHELLVEVGALHATIGAWPTYDLAMCDTWLTRMVLDTPSGDIDLGLPEAFQEQISLVSQWRKLMGRVYARHPRWGTYLHDGHLAAIGGVERVRAEVEPARIERVSDLTYIQLTDSIDTGLTPLAGERRRRLEHLMAPILVGAPRPDAG